MTPIQKFENFLRKRYGIVSISAKFTNVSEFKTKDFKVFALFLEDLNSISLDFSDDKYSKNFRVDLNNKKYSTIPRGGDALDPHGKFDLVICEFLSYNNAVDFIMDIP